LCRHAELTALLGPRKSGFNGQAGYALEEEEEERSWSLSFLLSKGKRCPAGLAAWLDTRPACLSHCSLSPFNFPAPTTTLPSGPCIFSPANPATPARAWKIQRVMGWQAGLVSRWRIADVVVVMYITTRCTIRAPLSQQMDPGRQAGKNPGTRNWRDSTRDGGLEALEAWRANGASSSPHPPPLASQPARQGKLVNASTRKT